MQRIIRNDNVWPRLLHVLAYQQINGFINIICSLSAVGKLILNIQKYGNPQALLHLQIILAYSVKSMFRWMLAFELCCVTVNYYVSFYTFLTTALEFANTDRQAQELFLVRLSVNLLIVQRTMTLSLFSNS